MTPRIHTNTLEIWSKRLYVRPHCLPPACRQQSTLSTGALNPELDGKDIAVLGGGITGLASAFYLSEALPNAKVTLYEGSSRLGGWLHSTSIDVGNGNVVFEQGPRTLRPNVPNGIVTLDLVRTAQ